MMVLGFLIGMVAGGCLGVLITSLLAAAHEADNWEDAW